MLNRNLTRSVTHLELFSYAHGPNTKKISSTKQQVPFWTPRKHIQARPREEIDKTGTRLDICPRKSLVRFA